MPILSHSVRMCNVLIQNLLSNRIIFPGYAMAVGNESPTATSCVKQEVCIVDQNKQNNQQNKQNQNSQNNQNRSENRNNQNKSENRNNNY